MKARIPLSVIMSAALLLVPGVFAQAAKPDRDALKAFQAGLDQAGFYVTPGAASVFNLLDDWCEFKVDDARCVNTGPYLMLTVPKSATETNKLQRFKLRHDEAVVLIGATPPPARYFGFHAFVASRYYPDKKEGQERTVIVSTIGDTINNATIKTTGPTPFNSPIALIFTPDRRTEAGIRLALRRAGYPEAIINTYVLPASMLNLGDGETADEFQITLRSSIIRPLASNT